MIQARFAETCQSWVLEGRNEDSRPAFGPARIALARRLIQLMQAQMKPTFRPDFIGGVAGFDPHEDTLTEVAYFTSESAAREGEQKPLPADLAALWHEWQALISDTRYYDLTEPWLFSPYP